MSTQTRPVITLIGDNVLRITAGQTYVDPGATASDKNQGNVTHKIKTKSNVDPSQIGRYTVTYNVTIEGVSAQEVFRTVIVVDKATPIIIVKGDNPATVEINNIYDDAGATAIDQFQGELKVHASDQVNTNVAGKYKVTYTATNEGGITATATRDVHVLDALPTIKLNGPNPMDVDVFQPLELLGASGSDSYYGDLTNDIAIVNNVNMNIPGTYNITYNLTNPAGMSAIEQIRTVRVIDPIAPKISVTGPNPYIINKTSTPYIEQGATATDKVYGSLTQDVLVSGVDNVDLTTPGVYEVTYNVTNQDKLSAITQFRTVHVIDTSKAEHTMKESAGTHGVTLSDSFMTWGRVYLGLAKPSQDPDFDFIDVTSKVIADMGDTRSFTLTNGDINSWKGNDVAPGKRKSLYFFDI